MNANRRKFFSRASLKCHSNQTPQEINRLMQTASKENFSADNFHGMTAHTDVDDLVTRPSRAEKNSAPALHLHALLHQHLLVRRHHAILHRPRRMDLLLN